MAYTLSRRDYREIGFVERHRHITMCPSFVKGDRPAGSAKIYGGSPSPFFSIQPHRRARAARCLQGGDCGCIILPSCGFDAPYCHQFLIFRQTFASQEQRAAVLPQDFRRPPGGPMRRLRENATRKVPYYGEVFAGEKQIESQMPARWSNDVFVRKIGPNLIAGRKTAVRLHKAGVLAPCTLATGYWARPRSVFRRTGSAGVL